jgi:RNA polymerase sigma-70 factor (ECF subfamily)
MSETPISLLERLRLQPDEQAWRRLVELYTPWIRGWLHRELPRPDDVEDLVQDVMAVLVRELPSFRHDSRRGAFRRWLRHVILNRLRTYWRKQQPQGRGGVELDAVLGQLEDPESNLSRLWDQEHNEHVVRRLLELIEPDFEPATWRAFRQVTLEGKTTAEAAAELGMSPTAVRIAKSRVLRRFRQEITGLIE